MHCAALTDDKGHVPLVVKESGLTDMGENTLISEKQDGSLRTLGTLLAKVGVCLLHIASVTNSREAQEQNQKTAKAQRLTQYQASILKVLEPCQNRQGNQHQENQQQGQAQGESRGCKHITDCFLYTATALQRGLKSRAKVQGTEPVQIGRAHV